MSAVAGRCALVVNPTAGRGRAGRLVPTVSAALREALPGTELTIVESRGVEHAEMRYTQNAADGLKDVRGTMIIENWQEGLKKVTWRVVWDPDDIYDSTTGKFATGPASAPGDDNVCPVGQIVPGEYCQTSYIDAEANYRQGP